ncbi:hypothetical protein KIW84_063628 [Lathyrus oleraceus]|uniref:Uncharacterized protein n=1 Tax=Pisum sativum TaxID=3888 RepID=A0A9D4W9G3_PEA|nr:hypothetical protein KIW84_063628 [Pisum sativum]
MEVDREMFVEHDVNDIEVTVKSPRCVNEMVELDGCDDEGVERFNDSEDERTTAIAYGFMELMEKYALCYGFVVSPINGQEIWLEFQSEELLPPMYKKGPSRSRKLRIREYSEDGARRRLPGVSYRFTKCDKF